MVEGKSHVALQNSGTTAVTAKAVPRIDWTQAAAPSNLLQPQLPPPMGGKK